MTDIPGIARAAQTAAARALRVAGLDGSAAAVLLHRAAALAGAAYDHGVPVAQVHPPLIPPYRRALRMRAAASTTTPLPTPRQPVDDRLTEQQHLIDEANNPQIVDAFRALPTTGRA